MCDTLQTLTYAPDNTLLGLIENMPFSIVSTQLFFSHMTILWLREDLPFPEDKEKRQLLPIEVYMEIHHPCLCLNHDYNLYVH